MKKILLIFSMLFIPHLKASDSFIDEQPHPVVTCAALCHLNSAALIVSERTTEQKKRSGCNNGKVIGLTSCCIACTSTCLSYSCCSGSAPETATINTVLLACTLLAKKQLSTS